MKYDENNVFAKILRSEIPCRKVFETNMSLSFYDINPEASTHILVIPKGKYVSHTQFFLHASKEEIVDFFQMLGKIGSKIFSSCSDSSLFNSKIACNEGKLAGQEVFHFHAHIISDIEMEF